jgi:hypothetical protein
LQLNKHDVLGEGKSYADPEFLMEVLSMREELAEASSKKELHDLADSVKESYRECVANLRENFQKSDFEAAKQNTIYLQYYTKILEEIENAVGESILDKIENKNSVNE